MLGERLSHPFGDMVGVRYGHRAIHRDLEFDGKLMVECVERQTGKPHSDHGSVYEQNSCLLIRSPRDRLRIVCRDCYRRQIRCRLHFTKSF